ncbi:MAG: hypothetical protein QNJ62_12835, partial [Methyloceanibacter sp.]|nr:hypothetical protein [Methyloceanibacter sp.]
MCNRSARWSVLFSSLVAASVFTGAGSTAYAQCTGTAPNFECSGSNVPSQSISADNATVQSKPGFSVSATNKNALSITGKGAISYTDEDAASLTSTSRDALHVYSRGNDGSTNGSVTIDVTGPLKGGSTGLSAINKGSGTLSIDANGTVSGNKYNAISATNHGKDLSIETGKAVTGARTGISATNYGTGATAIKTDGIVTGKNSYGLYAANRNAASTDLTIDANDTVAAKGTGIYALNEGAGKLTVDAIDISAGTGISAANKGLGILRIETSGAIEGKTGNGIQATNRNTKGAGLTIATEKTVTAARTAISATNYGTGLLMIDADGEVTGQSGISSSNRGAGALTIDAAGKVTGSKYNALSATNYGVGLTVTTHDAVSGTSSGIAVTSHGAGATTVTSNGMVEGKNSYGIYAANRNSSTTDVSIEANKAVSAKGTGIYALNEGSGKLTVDAAGINAGSGISATNKGEGALAVRVSGAVQAKTGNGVRATSTNKDGEGVNVATKQAVTAKRTAISVSNAGKGPLTIDADDDISGETGISANNKGSGALEIDTAGKVTATKYDGIGATNAGTDLSIVTHDAVAAARTGIYAANNGSGKLSIKANKDIDAGSGISATNNGRGPLTVESAGTVTAKTGNGITASNRNSKGSDLTVTAKKSVTAQKTAISASNNGLGALTVTALDAVTAKTGSGISATNKNKKSSTLAIATKKTVSAKKTAISATHYGTGPLTIDADADISGETGVYASNRGTGAVSIDTAGKLTASKYDGISASNAGTDLSITAHDSINAARTGITATNNGKGKLTIGASGDVSGGTRVGIQATNKKTGTDLSIATAEGTAVSGTTGIAASNSGSGTLNLNIGGDAMGTKSHGISTNSYGTDAKIATGSKSRATGATTGLRTTHRGTGTLTLDVEGAVEGLKGQGIYAYTESTEAMTINTGGAVSGTKDGIYAWHRKNGPINVTVGADSVITSTGKTGSDYAIETVGGPTNLVVAGTLNPGAGGAVKFDASKSKAFNDRLELHPTAVVNGKVLAGPGTDTLAFGGSGEGDFDLAEIDTGDKTKKYQSFELFEVNSGTWSFSGETQEIFTVSGGVLKGTGTFGDLIANGGVIALGNSIGTMTVEGAFDLKPGSVFEVEVNDAGESDVVIAKGTVNLTGSTLRVLAQSGNYKTKTDYMIIKKVNEGAVEGKFAKIETNYAFLTPTVVYDGGDGNDVVLTLLRTVVPTTADGSSTGGVSYLSFCSVADSKNQCDMAEALDHFPTDNALYYSVLTQTEQGARQAFNALSGEIHATVSGMLVEDSRYAREAVMGRLMQANHRGGALGSSGPLIASYNSQAMMLGPSGPYDGRSLADATQTLAFWTQGFGAWGSFDSNKNAASADRNLGGFISGMDADVGGGWRVGLATGASF